MMNEMEHFQYSFNAVMVQLYNVLFLFGKKKKGKISHGVQRWEKEVK